MSKVIVVTGASSGIGYYTAEHLVKMGHTVYALSRRGTGPEGAKTFSCDVTKEDEVKAVINAVFEKEKLIDIVINCAGFGISGAVEFTELEDAKRLFDVDFFGTVNVNKAVLPIMRAQKSGRIINISSVAAPAAIPFQTYYSAAKAAVDCYTLALRNEVRPFGIEVGSIQPGDIHTGFTDAREKSIVGDDIYKGRIEKSVNGMEHDELTGMDPSKAGLFVATHALKRHIKPQVVLGNLYKVAAVLLRILPVRFSNWLVYKLYG